MAPLSVSNQKAWRLANGIALVMLGITVSGIGLVSARLDAYTAFITGGFVITGAAMIAFHRF